MDWWAPVVGIGLSVLIPLLKDRAQDAVGRRRAARIADGQEDRVPVRFGLPGRLERAHVIRSGDDLLVVGRRARVAVPARALADPATGTWHVEGRDEDVRRRFALAGPGETVTHLDVAEHLVPALLELARRRPSAVSSGANPRRAPSGRPRTGVLVGLVLTAAVLNGGLAFQALYATGVDVTAHVDDVVRQEAAVNGYECHVSWTDPWEGSRRTAVVDCENPVQRIGSSTSVHALHYVWPGTAMDLAGSYEALSGLSLGALLLTGAPTLLVWRHGRGQGARALVGRAEPARSAPEPPSAGPQDSVAHDGAGHDGPPLADLARLVNVRERREEPLPGWQSLAKPTLPRLLVQVVRRQTGWGIALVVLGSTLAGLWDSVPSSVRLVASVALAGAAVAVVGRAVTSVSQLTQLGRVPASGEYEVVGLGTSDDEQLTLLCTQDVARWVVGVRVHLGHGLRAGVRGDLEGGLVQLVVDGHEVMTTGPVRPVDADLEDDLRGVVDFLLEGQQGAVPERMP